MGKGQKIQKVGAFFIEGNISDELKAIIQYMNSSLTDKYLVTLKNINFDVPKQDYSKMKMERLGFVGESKDLYGNNLLLTNSIRRIAKEHREALLEDRDKGIVYRGTSEHYDVIMQMNALSLGFSSESVIYATFIYIIDPESDFVIAYALRYGTGYEEKFVQFQVSGPMMFGNNVETTLLSKDVKRLDSFNYIDSSSLSILSSFLKAVQNNIRDGVSKISDSSPVYSNTEIKFFNENRRLLKDEFTTRVLLQLTYEPAIESNVMNQNTKNYVHTTDIYETIHMLTNHMSLLKLTRNDYKFIGDCATEKGYMNDTPYNFIPALTEARLGVDFVYPLSSENGHYEIMATSRLYDDNCMDVYLSTIIPETYDMVLTELKFKDVNNFRLKDSLYHLQSNFVLFTAHEWTYKSVSDMRDALPNALIDEDYIVDVAMMYLSLLMVIKEQPTKYRMINQVGQSDEDKNPECKNNVSKDQPGDVDNEGRPIIRRILMTKSRANNFIKKQNQGRREPIYVLESWYRSGYDRRCKDGRVVHIEPTTCYRHLPISETPRDVFIVL